MTVLLLKCVRNFVKGLRCFVHEAFLKDAYLKRKKNYPLYNVKLKQSLFKRLNFNIQAKIFIFRFLIIKEAPTKSNLYLHSVSTKYILHTSNTLLSNTPFFSFSKTRNKVVDPTFGETAGHSYIYFPSSSRENSFSGL